MLSIDTQKSFDLFIQAGFNEEQAQALVEFERQKEDTHLATKQDLTELESALRQDIVAMESSLRQDMTELESSIRQDMIKLESKVDRLDDKIDDLKSYITSRMYIGQTMAVVAVIGALKLFGVI